MWRYFWPMQFFCVWLFCTTYWHWAYCETDLPMVLRAKYADWQRCCTQSLVGNTCNPLGNEIERWGDKEWQCMRAQMRADMRLLLAPALSELILFPVCIWQGGRAVVDSDGKY